LGRGTDDYDDTAPDYCCSGCRAVAGVEAADAEQGVAASNLMRLGLAIFFTMNLMVFTMALWSADVYPEASFVGALPVAMRDVFRWASLVFSLPVLWLLGGPIASGVWQALSRRAITTDLLILLGVSAAYVYSAVSVLRGSGHVYFETAAMVLVFVSLGRWLEAKGKRRTSQSLDALAELLPPTVRRLTPRGDFAETPRADIVTGDVLRVLPGERLPVDGHVVAGCASIDQQMVTGESHPAARTVGDEVYSGTLNIDGDLRIEVTAADGQETVSRLIDAVRTARSVKGRQELLVDRIAAWFVPTVCTIAILSGWYQGNTHGLDQRILTSLAVVLIACPCALGLATPMAVWTALGRAAEGGVVFRSGMVMQQLATIRTACFDKTGTLTSAAPAVTELLAADPAMSQRTLRAAAALVSGSNHPLSHAIGDYARRQPKPARPCATETVETLPGRGLRGTVADCGEVLLGSRPVMDQRQLRVPDTLQMQLAAHDGAQLVFVGWQGEVRGVFCFAEAPRPEAAAAVAACRQLGLELNLLTGDSAPRAAAAGEQFGITSQSGLLPSDKVAAIRALAGQGGVAMIGDGLNDAPALAAATVGVALGCGADVSRDAAGVCLLADDLERFPWAVELARTTNRVVKQNLAWAFTYNSVGIALAATGQLNPIWAALAMAISSLAVVTNSLRLKNFQPSQSPPPSVQPAAFLLQPSPLAPP